MNPSILITPNSKKAGKLDSIIPTDGTGDLDVVRATTATYVDADGLIKTALANEPRFDYLNGSCPSILVEPQRTNLLLQSNNFISSDWFKTNATVNPNATISPDGTMNGSRVTATGLSAMVQYLTMTNGTTYTVSCWIKSAGTGKDNLRLMQQTNRTLNITATNEWVKYTYTFTNTYATGGQSNGIIRDTLNNDFDVYVYGFQLEAGSNATSYIPTTTTSVTRNADVISKSGISDLIGQTEGTMFIEMIVLESTIAFRKNILKISDGTNSNYIQIAVGNTHKLSVIKYYLGAVYQFNSSITNLNLIGNHKIAITYKNNEIKIFFDGSLNATTTSSGSIPLTNKVDIDGIDFQKYIKSCQIYKKALSDAEAIQLTTL